MALDFVLLLLGVADAGAGALEVPDAVDECVVPAAEGVDSRALRFGAIVGYWRAGMG